ncbi:MAG: gentisate 1,2-dioxygenase [Gammaproteobacteria bacterium]|nr:gentisate 1,2-dioxygenase [Gammaproteobacteria bacterium]
MSQLVPDTPELKEFYKRLPEFSLAPLWTVLSSLITPVPVSRCQPAHWDYKKVRPLILESGSLITAKQAERRVLILENPGMPGESKITDSLYAGLQLILPGEVAPAHRHSQSALRFIVEGSGAYTAVDGEKTIMEEGDFVITPSWTWHDHGNDSTEPMVWLDGLDIPLVSMLDASFFEKYPDDLFPQSRPVGDALARYGSGLLPVGYEQVQPTSPVFNYPFAKTREALEQMKLADEWDPCHGLKSRYVNPVTGDYAMPTMATHMQLLPKGFESAAYRSTDATVFSVAEGNGKSKVGGQTIEWQRRDTFVVPSWTEVRHFPLEESYLFSFSNRPVQEKLGLWREKRGAN